MMSRPAGGLGRGSLAQNVPAVTVLVDRFAPRLPGGHRGPYGVAWLAAAVGTATVPNTTVRLPC
jgi:hypothetical protein